MNENNYDSIQRLPRLDFYSENQCRFKSKNNYFDYNFVTNELQWINSVPDTAENIDFENDTRFIAYTVENNLFIAIDGKVKQVTFDYDKEIVNGKLFTVLSLVLRKEHTGHLILKIWHSIVKMNLW